MNSSARKREFVTAIEARSFAMRFFLAAFFVVMLAIAAPAATGEKAPPSGVESIGGRLLDDLSPDAGQPVAPPKAARDARTTREIEDSLRASTPLHGLGAATSPAAQSLARVRNSMQQAQSLLSRPGADGKLVAASQASPVQHQIISDLDKLIADLSKQCQCCNGQCQGGQCDKPPKPGAKPGKPGASSGRTAARDSTDRLDRTTAKPVDKGEVNEMVKALWGNLPERSREQMLQSFSDEFLPKYEIEIEQYYRRLSEEQGDRQSR
jgi:hypothetical protein